MDEFGCVAIPKEMSEALGWDTYTRLRMAISEHNEDVIVLMKISSRCSLCLVESAFMERFEKGHICPVCKAKLKKYVKSGDVA